MNWRRQRAVERPRHRRDALTHRGVPETDMPSQILQRSADAMMRQQDCASLIDALRLRCRPSAIGRLVMAVVFDAVDRVSRRGARPHVGVELFEGVEPLRTDGNASASIASIATICECRAACNHVRPDGKFSTPRQAMGGRTIDQLFNAQASAGLRHAFLHVAPVRLEDGAAVTLTPHARMSRIGAKEGENRQSPVSIAWLRLGFLTSCARLFAPPAAARMGAATRQTITADNHQCMTRASAEPPDAVAGRGATHDGETVEGVSGQIFEWWHNHYSTTEV